MEWRDDYPTDDPMAQRRQHRWAKVKRRKARLERLAEIAGQVGGAIVGMVVLVLVVAWFAVFTYGLLSSDGGATAGYDDGSPVCPPGPFAGAMVSGC